MQGLSIMQQGTSDGRLGHPEGVNHLIQEQDAGIFDKGPGNRNALLLAAR